MIGKFNLFFLKKLLYFSALFFGKQKGFTMVEIVISIAILMAGVIGIYAVFFPSFNATYNVSSKLTAVYLAQEALEVARNIRDNNFIRSMSDPAAEWTDGLAGCELGCQLDYKTGTPLETLPNQMKDFDPSEFLRLDSDNLYGYDGSADVKFQRKITITPVSGMDTLRIFVSVSWNYRGEDYNFETGEYLYNWH